MEIEYKWDMPDTLLAEQIIASPGIASHIVSHETIHMSATYYDTPGQDVRALGGGLRIRQENDRSVCCLKLAAISGSGCKTRREFEVDAGSITEGLHMLPEAGAPQEICDQLLALHPVPTCWTDFTREAYMLELGDFSAELAIDRGTLGREDRSAPISEIELEYLDGSQEAFHTFAEQLNADFALEILPLSKLARAVNL